jgi:hypothetical protein
MEPLQFTSLVGDLAECGVAAVPLAVLGEERPAIGPSVAAVQAGELGASILTRPTEVQAPSIQCRSTGLADAIGRRSNASWLG